MPRIALAVERFSHPPAAQIGYSLSSARITAHVLLKTQTGWTQYRRGIIDTGAAVSLIPADIWQGAEYESIGAVRVGGIVPRGECRIHARLAKLTCALSDGLHVFGPLLIHAYLAESGDVPLLLGVSDPIETVALTVAVQRDRAVFE